MKQLTALVMGLALFVPAVAGAHEGVHTVTHTAQAIQTLELQELLAQDRQQLLALNGQDAVRAYIFDLLLLIAQQQGFQTQEATSQELYGDPLSNSSYSNTNSSDDDEEVEVETDNADDVRDDSAELRGEIEEGDNVKVWFALSRTDSTPSCNSSAQRVSVDDRYDAGDEFEEDVDRLREDTRYYFRACAQEKDGGITSGNIKRFTTDDENGNSNNGDEEPSVDLDGVDDIEEDSAELNGSVDMNDFRDGLVFFLWGEDEDEVEDATDEDEYADIDENGDDLQKKRMDTDLDGDDDYSLDIDDLDDDTDYYYTLCVEYEDEDDDQVLECASIDDFRTDD